MDATRNGGAPSPVIDVNVLQLISPTATIPPETCNFSAGVKPIPTLPELVIINGVLSGYELSSTINAGPVPICVTRMAASLVLALTITEPAEPGVRVILPSTGVTPPPPPETCR